MAVLRIREFGDPVLKVPARRIEKMTEMHQRLAADMLETMRAAPGVGLAGNQVGVLERIFVWEVGDRHGVFVNPEITYRSDSTFTEEEGCLSIPGIHYEVERSDTVVVEGLDEKGRAITIEGTDMLARVFQHEIDHLDGILFFERLADGLRKEALAELRALSLGLGVASGLRGDAF